MITKKYAHLKFEMSFRYITRTQTCIFCFSGLGAEFSSDIYVDQRYEKKLFIAWQNVSISLCTWKEYCPAHDIFFHFALNWHMWYLMSMFDFMKLLILSMFSKLFLAVCWVRLFPDLLLTQPNQLRSWEALLCKIHTSSIPQVLKESQSPIPSICPAFWF